MEHGFYHPSRGYWQTTGWPSDAIRANYPSGWVEVPIKPGADYDFIGAEWVYIEPNPTADQVTVERDRRIAETFTFNGVAFQLDADARQNIQGAKTMASDAIALGALTGDYSWQQLIDPVNGAAAFGWIATDNSVVPMDAQTVVQFGHAAALHKQKMIFAAAILKAMDPIPADYATNEAYWT